MDPFIKHLSSSDQVFESRCSVSMHRLALSQQPDQGQSLFHFGLFHIVARLSGPIAVSAGRAEQH
jgi:hypothetical protein